METKDFSEKALASLGQLVVTQMGKKAMEESVVVPKSLIEILTWEDKPKCQEYSAYILMVLAHQSWSQREKMAKSGIVAVLLEVSLLGSPLVQNRAVKLLQWFKDERNNVRMGPHSGPQTGGVSHGVGSSPLSPRSGVEELVTGFLKNKLKFRGFVISNWQGIDKITAPPHLNYSYSVYYGTTAGIDMIMVPYKYTEFIEEIKSQIETRLIPISRIDDAVKRILRVKFTVGLFEEPLADLSFVDQLCIKAQRELAQEACLQKASKVEDGDVGSRSMSQ